MKKKNLELFHINGDYVKYLKSFDNNVQNNYDNSVRKKPYVGVVLNMNGKDYFAPLTSPKDKHLKLRDSDPTTFKIKHNGKFIGSVLLNNMIPVRKEFISKIDINSIQDRVYQDLLRKDYRVLSANKDNIENKANVLYKNVIERKNPYFSKVSCDFKKLESACDNYSQHIQKQDKLYQIDFSFNKEQSEKLGNKSYDVLVNGVKADELQKKDSQLSKALEGLANHKDMREKGITTEALKSGLIQPKQLANEIKVTKPEARLIDSAGNKLSGKDTQQGIAKAKSKDFAL